MSTRCNPAADLDILRHTWGSRLDPSVNPHELRLDGSKVLVNACKEHRYLATFPKRMALDRQVWEQVAARWNRDLGLPGSAPRPWTLVEPQRSGGAGDGELARPSPGTAGAGPHVGNGGMEL
jgi:hypothetical protein